MIRKNSPGPIAGFAAAVRRICLYTAGVLFVMLLCASFEGEFYIHRSRSLNLSPKTVYEAFCGSFTDLPPDAPEYDEATILKYKRILYYDSRLSSCDDPAFDQETVAALLLFQNANSLPATGQLDQATRDFMDRYDPSYSKGMKGDEILALQESLVKLKYLKSATGTFDDATYLAVIYFQQDNSLEMTGRLDAATKAALAAATAKPQ